MTKKKYLLIGVIVAVVAGFGWVIFGRKPQVAYDAVSVSRGEISDVVELSGKVQAGKLASLRLGAGGLVTYLGAKEGDTVQAGQTLASLDTRTLQKTMEEKLNTYAIQRGTFDQTVSDNSYSVPSGDVGNTLQRLLAKNQYQLENTVKDVEYQDLLIRLSRIYSPFKGILVAAPVTSPGSIVLPTDTWTVVDPSSLEFDADLDETDLKNVHVGQSVLVSLDAYPGRTVTSTVASISFSPTETSTSTTYTMKIILPKDALADLRLGLNGTADVVKTEKDNVLLLPASAISEVKGKPMVTVKDGKNYKQIPVETGIENGGSIEVVSGVAEGNTVYVQK